MGWDEGCACMAGNRAEKDGCGGGGGGGGAGDVPG